MPETENIRLSKIMSHRGLSSRREADKLIEQHQVKVNGQVVTELGFKCQSNAEIEILSSGKQILDSKVSVILYKPIGYISGPREEKYPSALDLIQPENKLATSKGPKMNTSLKMGMAPAGRLDVDSTGLLILTSNGVLVKKLIHESEVEKEYRVRVKGQITEERMNLLRHGLSLDDKPLKPAVIELDPHTPDCLIFILKEGKKRQIRRMCELVQLQVVALRRVRIGNYTLKSLKPGQWRYI